MESHKTNSLGLARKPYTSHKPQTITLRSVTPPGPHIGHNDEKIALVLALASGFAIWNMFR